MHHAETRSFYGAFAQVVLPARSWSCGMRVGKKRSSASWIIYTYEIAPYSTLQHKVLGSTTHYRRLSSRSSSSDVTAPATGAMSDGKRVPPTNAKYGVRRGMYPKVVPRSPASRISATAFYPSTYQVLGETVLHTSSTLRCRVKHQPRVSPKTKSHVSHPQSRLLL